MLTPLLVHGFGMDSGVAPAPAAGMDSACRPALEQPPASIFALLYHLCSSGPAKVSQHLNPGFHNHFPKRKPDLLGEMADPRLGQEVDQIRSDRPLEGGLAGRTHGRIVLKKTVLKLGLCQSHQIRLRLWLGGTWLLTPILKGGREVGS